MSNIVTREDIAEQMKDAELLPGIEEDVIWRLCKTLEQAVELLRDARCDKWEYIDHMFCKIPPYEPCELCVFIDSFDGDAAKQENLEENVQKPVTPQT